MATYNFESDKVPRSWRDEDNRERTRKLTEAEKKLAAVLRSDDPRKAFEGLNGARFTRVNGIYYQAMKAVHDSGGVPDSQNTGQYFIENGTPELITGLVNLLRPPVDDEDAGDRPLDVMGKEDIEAETLSLQIPNDVLKPGGLFDKGIDGLSAPGMPGIVQYSLATIAAILAGALGGKLSCVCPCGHKSLI